MIADGLHDGNDTWTLVIDVPSFRGIAALNGEIRQFLKQTRCSLNGGSGKKPAGWVLSGNRRAVLKNWPTQDKPLVGFEKNLIAIEHILESECRIGNGPDWLFRIGRDGTARENSGRMVRPGYDYILASKKCLDDLRDGMKPCIIDCSGIEAIRISVPSEVSVDYAGWLRDRGLNLARTIRVWPAGLPGRNWDGEGRSEWLTTEKPCFGIVSDHPVDSYLMTLDQDSGTVVRAGNVGQPTFIQLPQLTPGIHVLTIKASRSASLNGETTSTQEGYVVLSVREPDTWEPATPSHSGLIVNGDPHDATLDIFWENEFDLTVFGPKNRSVTPSVILENADGEEIFNKQVSAHLDLPITPSTWRKCFLAFLRKEKCEWAYLEASSGLLKIDGQELGQYQIRFDYEALPIRWVLRQEQEELSVRLVDDTGKEEAGTKCRYFSMENPTKIESLGIEKALVGIKIELPGGLFVAQCGEIQDLVIVSTGLTGEGLEGLGVSPDYSDIHNDPATIAKAVRILRYWRNARLAGFLATVRRNQVMDGLLLAIYGALAGKDWAKAEADFKNHPTASRMADRLQNLLDHRGGFPTVLRRDATNMEYSVKSITTWYTDLAHRYDVCSDPGLCAFAISLASHPHRLPYIYPDELESMLGLINEHPLLLRGARFIALLCANHLTEAPSLLPRWQK